MPFEMPSVNTMIDAIDEIEVSYLSVSNPNPARVELIKLIKSIVQQVIEARGATDEDKKNVLFSAYVFVLTLIDRQYHYLPNYSRLTQKIKNALLWTDAHQPSSEKILIHLVEFYHHVSETFPDELSFTVNYQKKSTLLADIISVIRAELAKQNQKIENLLRQPPVPEVFKKAFIDIPKAYREETANRWWPNPVRERALQFIKWMYESVQGIYQEKISDIEDGNCLPSNLVLQGCLFYLLKSLEAECKLRKPNSVLYKIALKAMNLNSYGAASIDSREMALGMLKQHIELVKRSPHLLEIGKIIGIQETEQCLNEMEVWVEKELASLVLEKNQPGFIQSKTHAMTAYLATFGVKSVFQSATRNFVIPTVLSSMGGALLDSAAGSAGFVVFGPSGAIIATQMSHIARDQLLPAITTTIFASVLEGIGNAIANCAMGVVVLPFSMTAAGLQSLLSLYVSLESDKPDHENKVAWIKALISLPDFIFAMEKKEKICDIQGLPQILP